MHRMLVAKDSPFGWFSNFPWMTVWAESGIEKSNLHKALVDDLRFMLLHLVNIPCLAVS